MQNSKEKIDRLLSSLLLEKKESCIEPSIKLQDSTTEPATLKVDAAKLETVKNFQSYLKKAAGGQDDQQKTDKVEELNSHKKKQKRKPKGPKKEKCRTPISRKKL
ncbi:uncharacterized protein LOC106662442 [Cimex lectularius]|uniref:Uncharacterized protein n=1 Tax=Cimex lectularius TaxID=79782 RepID=A0A8I6RA15_CIMLE|nr:uncharacterized protein LOC106662442 [Cimex lectularius]